jgi:hypothetical protein
MTYRPAVILYNKPLAGVVAAPTFTFNKEVSREFLAIIIIGGCNTVISIQFSW